MTKKAGKVNYRPFSENSDYSRFKVLLNIGNALA